MIVGWKEDVQSARTLFAAIVKTINMDYIKLFKSLVSLIILLLVFLEGIETDFLDTSVTCTVANGVCETRCRCNEGFTNVYEFCLGKVGTPCTMTSDCIPDAACVGISGNKRCTCNNGYIEQLNNTECRLKVGRPCNVTAAQLCIQNAVCDVTGGLQNTCTCRQGYSAYNNNTECFGNVGATCTATDECIQHAVCRDLTCICDDLYTPSADKTTCIGYVGAGCHSNMTSCVANAECISGLCTCNPGYHGDKTCEKAPGKEDDSFREIVGIIIGCVSFVVLVLVGIVVYCCTRKK